MLSCSRRRFLTAAAATAAGALLAPAAAVATPALLKTDVGPAAPLTLTSKQGENLLDIARAYNVGYMELVAANQGIDPWLTPPGSQVRVPSYYLLPKLLARGILVNLASQRLFYFRDGGTIDTYPIGIGEVGKTTPLGMTKVVAKHVNPTWYPPPSIRKRTPTLPAKVPPGPDNPLGTHALRLGWPGYLIHGTDLPETVGRDVSNGCMHLYPEDIVVLFNNVTVGTPVQIVSQEVLASWVNGDLIVEVYPNKNQAHQLNLHGRCDPDPPSDLEKRVRKMTEGRNAVVDWNAVRKAGLERTGLPVRVAVMADAALG